MHFNTKIIAPPTAQHDLPALQFTGDDLISSPQGVSMVMVYAQVLDERVLIEALKKALMVNPYFAGRIVGWGTDAAEIVPNNEGVVFVSRRIDEPLPNYDQDHLISHDCGNYLCSIDAAGFDESVPLLQIKCTHYNDGTILGLTIAHALCDGYSTVCFLLSWSNLCKGGAALPFVFDRSSLTSLPVDADVQASACMTAVPRPALTPVPEPLPSRCFQISAAKLQAVAASAGKTPAGFISHHDIVTAYVWRLIVAASACADEDIIPLTLTYNTRKRVGVDENLFGNVNCVRSLSLARRNIISQDIGELAGLIRGLYSTMSAATLRADMQYWKTKAQNGSSKDNCRLAESFIYQGGLFIDNFAKFPIDQIDFGHCVPRLYEVPIFGNIIRRAAFIFSAAHTDAGGVYLQTTLSPAEMDRLCELIAVPADSIEQYPKMSPRISAIQ